jgi:DNA gyrase subunit B
VIEVVDRQADPMISETFHAPEGAAALVRYLNRGRSPLHAEVLRIQTGVAPPRLDLALQWTRAEGGRVHGYANGYRSQRGTHLNGFQRGFVRTLNRMLRRMKLADVPLPGGMPREGLTAVIFLDLPEPQWYSQTRERLNNPEADAIVAAATRQVLEQFFKQSPQEARTLGVHLVRLAEQWLAEQRPGRRRDPKVGRV